MDVLPSSVLLLARLRAGAEEREGGRERERERESERERERESERASEREGERGGRKTENRLVLHLPPPFPHLLSLVRSAQQEY